MLDLGGASLKTRARFLWGATSCVEEIVSSMVSLQACLTGLTLVRCARRFFFCEDLGARAKEERTISPPTTQDVHVLSDVVKAVLNLFQHRCPEVGARRSPRVSPLVEGGLNIVLHLQPILPLDGTPFVQRAPIIERLGGCGMTVAGVSQSHRESAPQDEVFSLHTHGTSCHGCNGAPWWERNDCHWSLCHSPSRSLAWPAPVFCLSEPAEFADVRSPPRSACGGQCNNSRPDLNDAAFCCENRPGRTAFQKKIESSWMTVGPPTRSAECVQVWPEK